MNNIELFFLKKFVKSLIKNYKNYIFVAFSIIIAVLTITSALAIFNGYETFLKNLFLKTESHVSIYSGMTSKLSLAEIKILNEYFADKEEIKACAPIILSQAIIYSKNNKTGSCLLKGIDFKKANQPIIFEDFIKEKIGYDGLFIGKKLAEEMSLKLNDTIKLSLSFNNNLSFMGIVEDEIKLQVKGIIESGLYSYDSKIVFIDEKELKKEKNYVYKIMLKDKYIDKVDNLKRKWNYDLKGDFIIQTWKDYRGSLFSYLSFQKYMLFAILSFLVVVSSFTVVNSLFYLVKSQAKEIAILKTIGLSNQSIKKIYLNNILGFCIINILLGQFFGWLLAYLISKQTLYFLKEDVYLVSKIYYKIDFFSLILVFVISYLIIYTVLKISMKYLKEINLTKILRS